MRYSILTTVLLDTTAQQTRFPQSFKVEIRSPLGYAELFSDFFPRGELSSLRECIHLHIEQTCSGALPL